MIHEDGTGPPRLGLRELPGPTWGGVARLAAVALQFGLLVLVVRAFELESKAFLRLMVLAWAGFVVHHLLPARFRMVFFAALSLAGIAVVLGPANAAGLVGVGMLLIGLAHLPVSFRLRLLLIGSAAVALAAMRADWIPAPWPAAIWPILGSMFMFRLMIYLYDRRNRAAPFDLWRALSYFFMLPNVCFPLYPVVDYKAFARSHFNEDPFLIYQKGLGWMLRGVVHLLLYRIVYQNFWIDPSSVTNAGEAAQSMATTFLLYLRISGDFHLIVGLLHLFGFNLSEAFYLWLVSNSFTDFWRRINIYWKEFMQKLFFNPAYFALKNRLGAGPALVAATTLTFALTWALHSYQWFWIRGAFPLRAQDVVFWGVLGAMVLANMLYEERRGRVRSLRGRHRTLRADVILGLRTAAMFAMIASAWSLWTAGSVEEWRLLVAHLLQPTFHEAAWIAASLALLGVAAVAIDRSPLGRPAALRRRETAGAGPFWRFGLVVAGASSLLLWVGAHPLRFEFEPVLADGIHRLRSSDKLNRRDAELLARGYYEDVTDVVRFNTQLAELYAEMPPDWNATPHILQTPDEYPPYRLRPSAHVTFRREPLSTNRWGMRDRAYERVKAPGTLRVAVLGDSHSFGSGVRDQETYENLVEDRLNREDARDRRYEILNFSVGGYGPLSRLAVLESQVFSFDPDLVLYVGVDDFAWIVNEVGYALEKGFTIPYPRVAETVHASGIEGRLPRIVAERRLAPHARELLAWVYGEFVARARERGVRPVATFIPQPEAMPGAPRLIAEQMEIAERAGFTVLDVSAAYGGVDALETLWVARWDRHPNAQGHRMLADALYRALSPHLARVDVASPHR
jgi:hypothetical protein